jgi:hypothetical protein
MINVSSTAQNLSNDYVGMGAWIGLATDDPGSTKNPANEAAGGGYARVKTTWTPGDDGVNQGSPVTIDLPSGAYPYMILCADEDGQTMIDNCKISDLVLNSDGQIVVIPTYTQT